MKSLRKYTVVLRVEIKQRSLVRMYIINLHMSKASERLKVVLLYLWRVNVKTIGGFICIALGYFYTVKFAPKCYNLCTIIKIGRHSRLEKDKEAHAYFDVVGKGLC